MTNKEIEKTRLMSANNMKMEKHQKTVEQYQ